MEQQRQLQRFVLPRIHILETIEYVKVIKKESTEDVLLKLTSLVLSMPKYITGSPNSNSNSIDLSFSVFVSLMFGT
jgi:ATP-dependent RNA circularization protein (DNA/RNA ligase family)